MEEQLIACLNASSSANIMPTAYAIIDIVQYHERQEIEMDFDRFQKWLLNHNAEFNGLHLKSCEYGSGVFALTDFNSSQLITRIPQAIMLSTEFHQRSDLNCIVSKDPMLKSMDSLVLCMQLMQEDQDINSFYRPYLDVLPRKLPKLPIIYNRMDLDQLKGSHVQYDAAIQIILHAKEFLYISGISRQFKILKDLDWSYFVWARVIIMTRQNKIPTSNGLTCLALIPFFDMFNHKLGEITTFFDSESKTSETYTNYPISKGEQVYISYGKRSNSDLFLFSGFVDTDNTLDIVKIWIDMSDKIIGSKIEILEKLRIPQKGFFKLEADIWNTCEKLILYLWVAFSSEEECTKLLCKKDSSSDLKSILSFESENHKKVVDWILMRCKVMISSLSKRKLDSSQVSKLFLTELRLYKSVLLELS